MTPFMGEEQDIGTFSYKKGASLFYTHPSGLNSEVTLVCAESPDLDSFFISTSVSKISSDNYQFVIQIACCNIISSKYVTVFVCNHRTFVQKLSKS